MYRETTLSSECHPIFLIFLIFRTDSWALQAEQRSPDDPGRAERSAKRRSHLRHSWFKVARLLSDQLKEIYAHVPSHSSASYTECIPLQEFPETGETATIARWTLPRYHMIAKGDRYRCAGMLAWSAGRIYEGGKKKDISRARRSEMLPQEFMPLLDGIRRYDGGATINLPFLPVQPSHLVIRLIRIAVRIEHSIDFSQW